MHCANFGLRKAQESYIHTSTTQVTAPGLSSMGREVRHRSRDVMLSSHAPTQSIGSLDQEEVQQWDMTETFLSPSMCIKKAVSDAFQASGALFDGAGRAVGNVAASRVDVSFYSAAARRLWTLGRLVLC